MHFKIIPRGVLRHAEIPRDKKKSKMPKMKIWSFLIQNRGLTPWQKVDFWTKDIYSFKNF